VMVPLLRKQESIYVTSGSRAEHVALRNASKRVRYIDYRPEVSTPDNFVLGLRHRFDSTRAVGVQTVIEFTFPDGAITVASICDGKLTLDSDTVVEPNAAVTLSGNEYIQLLHPELGRQRSSEPTYLLDGDPAALGALLACLS
jgi:alkyl sulfatase BDS1-like metallo-beta-lactamase superfamily hydrolase